MSAPAKNWFDTLDDGVYKVERLIVSVFFIAMTLAVFFDVTHRIFVVPSSRFADFWVGFGAGEELAASVLGPATLALLVLAVLYGALRERWGQASSRRKALGAAAGGVVALAIALKLFLAAFPNGLIWSQTLGLSLMFWIGIIGASMAAKQRRHLALEFGNKIWPEPLKPFVRFMAGMLVAVFCAFLAYLAYTLIRAEFNDYDPVYGTGVFTGLPLPKFLVYSILPYGFFMIVVRYFRATLSGGEDVDEAQHILSQQKQDHA